MRNEEELENIFSLRYKSVIVAINEELLSDEKKNKEENTKKEKGNKNELTPLQIASVANEQLRLVEPISYLDIKSESTKFILIALKYFMKMIKVFNLLIVYIPDKQLFSAFCGITVQTYDKLLSDPIFSEIMFSVEDYLKEFNFIAGQANLANNQMTQFKLQANVDGHSITKQVDRLTLIQNNYTDERVLEEKLSKWNKMIGEKGVQLK